MARLTIQTPSSPPTQFRLESERVSIGRGASNDLVLQDAAISREHLLIYKEGKSWVVEDLGSRNGTLLNGMALAQPLALRPGDELAMGDVLLVFLPSEGDPVGDTDEPATRTIWDPSDESGITEMVGESEPIRSLLQDVPRIAASDATVLILGENGTGKELVARLLHARSPRRDGPFVTVNCPALPGNLLETELFGVEKGVATGVEAREGKFETAQGGTIFLDEIGDMDPSAQAKILRVLQEKEIERVGGRKPISLNVRVLAATNQNLEKAVEEGSFRRDLFHRLNVITLTVPPLRKRAGDIPLLSEFFLKQSSAPNLRLSDRALEALESYPFPGNVRELQHMMERAAILARGSQIEPEDLPQLVTEPDSVDGSVVVEICRKLEAEEGTFWDLVQDPFMKRSLSAEDARQIVGHLYKESGNSYKKMAEQLGLADEYRKFFNFLHYHNLKVND